MNTNLMKCPDCAEIVPSEETERYTLHGFADFIHCPRCAVGSPSDEWDRETAALTAPEVKLS